LLEKHCPTKHPAANSVLAVRSQSYCDDSVSDQMQCDGEDSLLQVSYWCFLLETAPGKFHRCGSTPVPRLQGRLDFHCCYKEQILGLWL